MLQILDLTNSSYTTLYSSEETHKRTVRNVDRFRVEYVKARNGIVSVRLSHDSNYVNALGVVFGVFEPYFILGPRWVMVAVQWITTTWTILLLCACLGTFSGADDCSFSISQSCYVNSCLLDRMYDTHVFLLMDMDTLKC
jgi:hypothetical protein